MKRVTSHLNTAHDSIETWLDFTSIGILLATFANMLPTIATLFTVTWLGIRIYESSTVQKLIQAISRRLRKK